MRARATFEVIRLAGELDIARKAELHETLLLGSSVSGVLLDLSDVTYADSTALTELLRFRRQTEQQNIPVALVVTSPQFDRVIRYAGLHEVFDIFDDRSQAVRYLESPS